MINYMPSCQKHLQYYNQDEYCVYCGKPLVGIPTPTDTFVPTCDHFFEALIDGNRCIKCGDMKFKNSYIKFKDIKL